MEKMDDRTIWVRESAMTARPLPLRKILSLPFIRLCIVLCAGTVLFVVAGLALDQLWTYSRQGTARVGSGADNPDVGPTVQPSTGGPQQQTGVPPVSETPPATVAPLSKVVPQDGPSQNPAVQTDIPQRQVPPSRQVPSQPSTNPLPKS